MEPLLAEISPEARWVVHALLDDSARALAPGWAAVSAFHLLRTRAPSDHPGFGTALLQWQRVVARFGPERAPKLGAEAFLGLARATPAHHLAARLLELWVRHATLPIELPGRLVALDHLPAAEAALVAEELALGAHEAGNASPGVLRLVAHRREPWFSEARAIAELERFTRGEADAETLQRALAPGLMGDEQPELPELTARLVGGMRNPVAYTPEPTPALEAVIGELRLAAARCPTAHPAANVARRIVACLPELTAEEVLALAAPDRAGAPAHDVGLPEASAVVAAVGGVPEPLAVQVALRFAALSGAVEQGAGLPGLTAWRASREPGVPLSLAHRARAELEDDARDRWDALAGGPLPTERPHPQTWPERLRESLRSGAELLREELLAAMASGLDVAGVLFDSPGGPGLLQPEGQLKNALRSWPAPERLRVAHPVDFFDAERLAWQVRLTLPGQRAPLNQLFREVHRAGGRELSRKRIERLRGVELRPVSLELLARRGWFPTLSPIQVPPSLELGPLRARLIAEPSPSGPIAAGVEFTRDGAPVPLADVPARLFSEAWRDVDEALALGMSSGSYVPSPARAELVRALAPQLAIQDLRVEADHVAFRAGGKPERITLHNARPAEGELVPEAAARARAAELLPFDDDGGVAALLVGRILFRARPESTERPIHVAPREGA